MSEERRTYKETYFWAFIACVIYTIASEHFGLSLQEVTNYADGILEKTYENINTLIVWIVPIAIMVKKEVSAWRKSMHQRDIEIAKIASGKTE